MGRIAVIGTNTFPLNRESTNFLIDFSDRLRLLTECCGSVTLRLTKMKYATESIDNLFLSHLHGDHTFGVPLYFHAFWTARVANKPTSEKINVLAEKEVYQQTLQISRTLFPYQINNLEKMIKINHLEISKEPSIKLNENCTLKPIPLQHTVSAYGYRIDMKNPSFSIAYVPDTRPFVNLSSFVENVDVLIHEAFCTEKMHELAEITKHSTAKEAAELAKKAGAKKLILVHILTAFHGREQEITDEASSIFSGEIILPNDFDIIEL